MSELASLTLTQAAKMIERREVTSVDLVEASLAATDRWEPHVKALVTRLDDRALKQARQADRELARGSRRGPLHGIPIMVKDLIDIEDVPTTAGSRILRDNIAQVDAHVIANLRRAGAIVTAKTNTHEFALGALTPPTRNPWDLDRMPGGSSGGSGAAVAARMTYGALGTDTAGSIREPSCLCGIVGLKPTFGRVSKRGVVPLAWSLDTVGPMARTVEDCALLLAGIEGHDPRDRSSTPLGFRPTPRQAPILSGLRVAVAAELMDPLHEDVRSSIEALITALKMAGVHIDEVSIGNPDEFLALIFIILESEAAAYHRKWLETCRELYSSDVLKYLEMGTVYSAMDYLDALRVRSLHQERMEAIFTTHDLILTPAQMVTAPFVNAETVLFPGGVERPRDPTLIRSLSPFSLTGLPALSIPTGLDRIGLPVGVQLVAAPFQDEYLLAASKHIQGLSAWTHPEPSLTS